MTSQDFSHYYHPQILQRYVSVILCTGGWLPSTPHMSHDQGVCFQGDLPGGIYLWGGGGVCLKGGRRRGMGCWTDLQALWELLTVNKWVVRILLECILVYDLFFEPTQHTLSFIFSFSWNFVNVRYWSAIVIGKLGICVHPE